MALPGDRTRFDKHEALLNTLEVTDWHYKSHTLEDTVQVDLVTLNANNYGWKVTVDVCRRVYWYVGIYKGFHGRIEESQPDTNHSLTPVLAFLDMLKLELVYHVQPEVKVGDIVTPTRKGWSDILYVVEKVRRVDTPATSHGYTYIASCRGYGKWGGGSDLLTNEKGELFRGAEYNHRNLIVIGNVYGEEDEVPNEG